MKWTIERGARERGSRRRCERGSKQEISEREVGAEQWQVRLWLESRKNKKKSKDGRNNEN